MPIKHSSQKKKTRIVSGSARAQECIPGGLQDEAETYEVGGILKKEVRNRKVYSFVKWKGWGP